MNPPESGYHTGVQQSKPEDESETDTSQRHARGTRRRVGLELRRVHSHRNRVSSMAGFDEQSLETSLMPEEKYSDGD